MEEQIGQGKEIQVVIRENVGLICGTCTKMLVPTEPPRMYLLETQSSSYKNTIHRFHRH